MRKIFVSLVACVLVVAIMSLTIFSVGQKLETRQHASTPKPPFVVNNEIFDAADNPLVLRGGQIEFLDYPGNAGGNILLTRDAFPKLVSLMHLWHMNTLRLPICNFLNTNDMSYITSIKDAVSKANSQGLYVIVDAHNTPACDTAAKQEAIRLPRFKQNDPPYLDILYFWSQIAIAFKNNPMVMFDAYNEPDIPASDKRGYYNDADWNLWKNGGIVNGVTYYGMQQIVDTIRDSGAQQIIIVEGFKHASLFTGIVNSHNDYLISDKVKPDNIVYEVHEYGMDLTPVGWDANWGFLSKTYNKPIFVGEWALLTGDNSGQINCGTFTTPQSAQAGVLTFLSYLERNKMSWSAYEFDIDHMLTDYKNFNPTVIGPHWVCPLRGNDVINHSGMGEIIQDYLRKF